MTLSRFHAVALALVAGWGLFLAAGCDEKAPPPVSSDEAPPPVADFKASVLSGQAPLNVTFTNLSEGRYDKAIWDFGDGCQSYHPQPTHIFSRGGVFTVSLHLYRGESIAASKTVEDMITVIDPSDIPACAFSATPSTVLVDAPVQFLDASTGDIESWLWDFGDGGSSMETNPEHAYAAPGLYDVTLTVSGPAGSDTLTRPGCVRAVAVFPPAADFTADVLTGTSPLAVQFTDATAGDVHAWSWDFGDGGTSTLRNPVHVFSGAAGSAFTVTLTATGAGGSDTETKSGYIRIAPLAPVADFSASPSAGLTPLTVNFQDLSSGVITSWLWNFGDGTTSTAQHPPHVYTAAGIFTVSLTVTGPGGSDTLTKPSCITTGSNPVPCVPVVYLYPETPRTEDVKVFLEGVATVTIPAIPLGRAIAWRDVETGYADGSVVYRGRPYPYLFYEAALDVPVVSHSGWVLEREADGRLLLDGEAITYAGLRARFEAELGEAGLFDHEIRDFTECWLGADAALFFGRETFRYAVRYFPADQLEAAMRLVTTWKYDSVVRVQFTVDHAPEGLELFEPVYAPAPREGSVLHEWGVVPSKCVLER